jgi:hypothetical protein
MSPDLCHQAAAPPRPLSRKAVPVSPDQVSAVAGVPVSAVAPVVIVHARCVIVGAVVVRGRGVGAMVMVQQSRRNSGDRNSGSNAAPATGLRRLWLRYHQSNGGCGDKSKCSHTRHVLSSYANSSVKRDTSEIVPLRQRRAGCADAARHDYTRSIAVPRMPRTYRPNRPPRPIGGRR